jgi:DNA-binding NtrC family response regulator
LFKDDKKDTDFSEREILYKVLFDMKNDLNQLKKVTNELIKGRKPVIENSTFLEKDIELNIAQKEIPTQEASLNEQTKIMTLHEQEMSMIKDSLHRHQGRRKDAADELGISERTLYRKIKEYKL